MLWEYRGHLVPTWEPRTRLLERGLGNRKLNKWQLTRGRNECNFKIEGERKEGGKKQREENKERREEAEDTIDSSALDSAPAQTTSDICHDSLLKSQGKARFLILPTLLG